MGPVVPHSEVAASEAGLNKGTSSPSKLQNEARCMRIAQVTHTFPPYMGGTGNVCYHNSLELARLGYDVTVITSRIPPINHTYPSLIKVRRFKPLFRIRNAPFIPQLLTLRDFDIVHLHYPFIFSAEVVLLTSKLRENVLVVTFHQDLIFGGFAGPLVRIYDTALKKIISQLARRILVPSLDYARHSSIARILQDRGGDVIELPNGVDTDRFRPEVSGEELRGNYIIDSRNVILFVGSLDESHRFKGLDVLLRAFSKLVHRDEAVLVVVGDGSLRPSYETLARALGISENVLFAGSVPDTELPKYYSVCDFLVLPSVSKAEIFGLVLVEAMATGKPVIASNLPGVRTVVDEGENGLLVEPKNADALTSRMQFLLDNKHIREEFGKRGREKAEKKYSWTKIGEKLETIYLELLS